MTRWSHAVEAVLADCLEVDAAWCWLRLRAWLPPFVAGVGTGGAFVMFLWLLW